MLRCGVETAPVTESGDAADDPAVWVHPTDRRLSRIIGTDKKSGLFVYDLSGGVVQSLPDGRMNNVDVVRVRDAVQGTIDLVVASNRSSDTIAAYRVDPRTGRLEALEGGPFSAGIEGVYGLCAYADPAEGTARVVVNNKMGEVRVLALVGGEEGRWASTPVRRLNVGGQVEGCVADVERGWLYIGEEAVGVWRYPLDPASERAREPLDIVASGIGGGFGGHLARDVEGVALYSRPDGSGWIVVSCQGENRYAAYDRGTGAYVGSFALEFEGPDGRLDAVTHTDGISACSAPLGEAFPEGVLVVQDDNEGQRQNFKIVDWRRVREVLGVGGSAPTKVPASGLTIP